MIGALLSRVLSPAPAAAELEAATTALEAARARLEASREAEANASAAYARDPSDENWASLERAQQSIRRGEVGVSLATKRVGEADGALRHEEAAARRQRLAELDASVPPLVSAKLQALARDYAHVVTAMHREALASAQARAEHLSESRRLRVQGGTLHGTEAEEELFSRQNVRGEASATRAMAFDALHRASESVRADVQTIEAGPAHFRVPAVPGPSPLENA